MKLGLDGKVALVTGASKGIGRAIALGLLAEGCSVLACARGQEGLLDLERATDATQWAGKLRIVPADLSKTEAVAAVVCECLTAFGKLDVLVNNAGSARAGEFTQLPDDAWIEDWTLKFLGYVRLCRAAYTQMKRQGSGVIVNIIGVAAVRPLARYLIGGSINAALMNFTKGLSMEAGESGIRVVGVNPGPIATERWKTFIAQSGDMNEKQRLEQMVSLRRLGEPEEVADLVRFLVSDRAAFIHGCTVGIDGGTNPGLLG